MRVNSERRTQVFKLYSEGKSYSQIGKLLGVTHQSIQGMIRPPKEIYNAVKARAGNRCELCGSEIRGHIHHKTTAGDFNKIENLQYLCPPCHHDEHLKLKPFIRKTKEEERNILIKMHKIRVGITNLPTLTVKVPNHFAIGEKIRKFRISNCIGLRELADSLGISAPYLSDLERGRRSWNQKKYDEVIYQITATARRNSRKGGRPKGR